MASVDMAQVVSAEADSPEDIRRQIEHTRDEIAETIDAIQGRLAPAHLKRQAMDMAYSATIGKVSPAVHEVRERALRVANGTVDAAHAATQRATKLGAQLGHAAGVRNQQTAHVNGTTADAAAYYPSIDGRTAWDRVQAGLVAGKQRITPAAHEVELYVRAYPFVACALTLGAGTLLGCAILRVGQRSSPS